MTQQTQQLSLFLDPSVAIEDIDFLSNFYQLCESHEAEWQLALTGDNYVLSSRMHKLSLAIDLNSGNYRHRNTNLSKEPLAAAVKIKKKLPQTLLDATPGVLKDSMMLAAKGVSVTAIERNPLLFVIMQRALSTLKHEVAIDYHFGDATTMMHDFSCDIIYLDPMYPSKKKKAQVKKDMQVLQHIVGTDDDAPLLLEAARKSCARIVVKRPSYAEPLASQPPSHTSQIGATRFDVYLPTEP